jgi:hypothetical protein
MLTLKVRNLAQVRRAEIRFGDLTVLVGPQATGKSIVLQFLKLLVDTGHAQHELQRHGLDWSRELPRFLDVYFGEGMRSIWAARSSASWCGAQQDMQALAARMRKEKAESLFFIPAQRVLTLRDGWPRPFTDYAAGDPYTVRAFSETLRLLMEQEFSDAGRLFPQERRLKQAFRELLQSALFSGFELKIDKSRSQKRIVLGSGKEALPYMVWSAGQREFVPLLLGLYWLMPPTKVARRRSLEWVVIEELEMGLHPKAISVVLLLVLELLARGYRVCLSTHSPQVLEMVWVLKRLQDGGGKARDLLDVFEAPEGLRKVAERAMGKDLRVYFFDRGNGTVQDISGLDPSAMDVSEAEWGGLARFSERANEVVTRVMAKSAAE